MNSAIYSGHIMHTRHIPKNHSFSYPFFMWYLDLEEMEKGINFGRWFSSQRFALSRFLRSDYLGMKNEPLAKAVKKKMAELTRQEVEGKVFGLLNLRTLGLYFSPVNFYFGFDTSGAPSHFLAEVSNIPWNERHYYGYPLTEEVTSISAAKNFKVSPFNPARDQIYTWEIGAPGERLSISLNLSDTRGKVFEAALQLQKYPLSSKTILRFLSKIPVMTVYIVAKIYWQALKIFLKGIPYIPYTKEKI